MDIKFFINEYEEGARELAQQMRDAGIRFGSIPTSGPNCLYVDGNADYGVPCIRRVVEELIKEKETSGEED